MPAAPALPPCPNAPPQMPHRCPPAVVVFPAPQMPRKAAYFARRGILTQGSRECRPKPRRSPQKPAQRNACRLRHAQETHARAFMEETRKPPRVGRFGCLAHFAQRNS